MQKQFGSGVAAQPVSLALTGLTLVLHGTSLVHSANTPSVPLLKRDKIFIFISSVSGENTQEIIGTWILSAPHRLVQRNTI